MTLSLVVPFHNSRRKADALLDTLESLNGPGVEIILVDDGSTDSTPDYLRGRLSSFRCPTRLIVQDNRGPGGARNSGLAAAVGRYVWFVDSDDDIDPAAIDEIRRLSGSHYDFIDFDIGTPSGIIDTMDLPEGDYEVDAALRQRLVDQFGTLVTKAYRRDFLLRNRISFPAYCIYEDFAMMFVLPLFTRSFRKSRTVGYRHKVSANSVTRTGGRFTPRFYDQLPSLSFGLDFALRQDLTATERKSFERWFTRFYRDQTASSLLSKRTLLRHWPKALRIMRSYRGQAAHFGLAIAPPERRKRGRGYDLLVGSLWRLSRLLPAQDRYFDQARRRAWRHPIEFPQIGPGSGRPPV